MGFKLLRGLFGKKTLVEPMKDPYVHPVEINKDDYVVKHIMNLGKDLPKEKLEELAEFFSDLYSFED